MATHPPQTTHAIAAGYAGEALVENSGGAEQRILRLFARFIGAGYLFYLLLLGPQIDTDAADTARWWTPVAVVTMFGPGLVLGVLSFRGRASRITVVSGICAIAYFGGIAVWPFVWNGAHIAASDGVWFSMFPGLASLAAAVAWRARRSWLAFAHLAVATTSVQLINHVARGPAHRSPLIPDVLFGFGFSLLFVAGAVMALHTGRLLDETRADTYAAAASAASMQARTVERQRFDALTHDGVMSTLLAASRRLHDAGLAQQSERTLRQLDTLRGDPHGAGEFDVAAAVSHFRAAAVEVDSTVPVNVAIDPETTDLQVPADVVRTMGAALAEALRNSVRHAGAGADRMVFIAVTSFLVQVIVADTGCGFDPSAVAPQRLGLAVSVRGRMRQLPGGESLIESGHDIGTRIELTWSVTT